MRVMSFQMTADAVREGRKDVTRRLGWRFLKPGDRFEGVEKYRGVPKAERVSLGVFEVVSVRRELLWAIQAADVAREGYPDLGTANFIVKFCKAMGCGPDAEVTRIEFRRAAPERSPRDEAAE